MYRSIRARKPSGSLLHSFCKVRSSLISPTSFPLLKAAFTYHITKHSDTVSFS